MMFRVRDLHVSVKVMNDVRVLVVVEVDAD